jgi:hypothetical protein
VQARATLEDLSLTGVGLHVYAEQDVIVSRVSISGTSTGVNAFMAGGSTLIVTSSIVSDNTGVGIYLEAGYARIENSTISNNHGFCGCSREGCFGAQAIGTGLAFVWLVNSTVADNECLDEADSWALDGIFFLQGTIVSNPRTQNCRGTIWSSGGHNLDRDGSCGLDASTDLANVDPLLGPLQDNGGPTPTHALLRGSPAIDAIPTRECVYDDDGDPETPAVRLATDQRGVTRPRNGDHVASSSCDIGAYETTKGANGIDDDYDGKIDFDGGATAGLPPEEQTAPDPHCASATCVQEQHACGLGGADLVLLGALAWGVARVRRR